MSGQFIYTMHRVSRVVPPNRAILKDISLSFFPGAKIGVLGLNGSGKSMLLRIMVGVDATFDGEGRARSPASRSASAAGAAARPQQRRARGNVEEAVAETKGAARCVQCDLGKVRRTDVGRGDEQAP